MKHRALLRHHDTDRAGRARSCRCARTAEDGTSVATIEIEMIEGGIGPARWREFAAFLATGLPTDAEKADLLFAAAAAHQHGADVIGLPRSLFRNFLHAERRAAKNAGDEDARRQAPGSRRRTLSRAGATRSAARFAQSRRLSRKIGRADDARRGDLRALRTR